MITASGLSRPANCGQAWKRRMSAPGQDCSRVSSPRKWAPEGQVFAVDIAEKFLETIHESSARSV